MTEMESYAKISGNAPDYFFLCRAWLWAESASYGKTSYSGNDEAHDCAFKRGDSFWKRFPLFCFLLVGRKT